MFEETNTVSPLPQPGKAGLKPDELHSGSSTAPSQQGWADAAHTNYHRRPTRFLKFAETTIKYQHTIPDKAVQAG